ncbi:membrane metallo-endopeptidase-like 1-like protein, partial [Leptotrombidium deliense]
FDEVLVLMNKLAEAAMHDTSKSKRLTLDQMEYTFPKVNWYRIFSRMFKKVNTELRRDEPAVVYNVHYFEQLGRILSSTNNRTIANYIALHVLSTLGTETIPLSLEIYRNKEHSTQEMEELCYLSTERLFTLALNHVYVRNYFSKELLQELKDFVKHLKASLTLTLQNNEWMDDETKLKAQLKVY